MSTSATERRQNGKHERLRNLGAEEFWAFSSRRFALRDSERLAQIKNGFPAHLFQAMRRTFDLQEHALNVLLNASMTTLERRVRERRSLGTAVSERLDRIATVSHLAERVFEDRDAAVQWLTRANKALGGNAPILLCETEIGAKQIRRALGALDSGGVV
ncbi:MbcA/ParS/Xre antitoxin family protein [Pseudomonas yamanorum]|uniref:type II RES/Xre toxin-antitoxin system antitoxin n=1 Tax=Pseudomonas yamanorum TaxID=515393 RepID=UPI001C448E89|nr:antitoxin Xre/MbcA/ParS toxin-binding domain-containing protein [Pseudomonas yamanorum]MBV6659688.1 MbcA/ParS/Xre antitoxin family protein [Pseudomonas yamanorum]